MILWGYSFTNVSCSLSSAREIVGKGELSELAEVLDKAEEACEVMTETVTNALDSARTRWDFSKKIASSQRVELLEVLELIHTVQRVRKRHSAKVLKTVA